MKQVVIIPARLESKRFPGKVLKVIEDKTLLQRCWESVKICGYEAFVATDNDLIEKEAISFGAKVLRTSSSVRNGTERVAEAANLLGLENDVIVVNCQADMFGFYRRKTISGPIKAIEEGKAVMATVGHRVPINDSHLGGFVPENYFQFLRSKHVVKMSFIEEDALLFGRDMKDFRWHAVSIPLYIHFGVYAARKDSFDWYAAAPPNAAEKEENLEQLRWQDDIHVTEISELPAKVDTEKDLKAAAIKAKWHDIFMECFAFLKKTAIGGCGGEISTKELKLAAYQQTMKVFNA